MASFAEYAVVPQSGAVPVRKDMPLEQACLIGCSVMTGVGAVINTAKVAPGSSVAVFGCGGVGLNVIQGAVLAGAERIIAVDVVESKLKYAREFGATDVIQGGDLETVKKVRDLTSGGADYAFEAIGNSRTILQAYESTCYGGVTTIVGMAPEDDEVSINALSLPRSEKVIMGSWYGSARPWVDLPKMVDLYLDGKIKIDSTITRTYPLDEINEAYEALGNGEVARSIIKYG
jgi:S-(hydroxymethyl)glutathione dehydrogenase/alcohol dehydrogenase